MEAEKDILDYLLAGNLALPPISFGSVSRSTLDPNLQVDAVLDASWQGKKYRFVAEVKRYGSEKTVSQAAEQAQRYAEMLQANPLVIVPWLSSEQLSSLEKRNVSGVDLCGNGVIVIPGEMLIFRTGQPNKFPTSRLIRRVYEGTSSLVARVLLLRSEYSSVSEILEEIVARGGNLTLPTVSKALKQLEEDVVIEKSKGQIRLLQAEKLLDRLRANYASPRIKEFARGKLVIKGKEDVRSFLRRAADEANARIVLSGESSVNFYATMAKEPVDRFYCTEFKSFRFEELGADLDLFSRFPNIELEKTDVEAVYFDMRDQSGCNVASPIQAYLELANSDKRGQETAEQIRRQILSDLTKASRTRSR